MNRYYTTFEAARLLGVSLPTVVNWIKARRIKAHRTPGGHRRIAREDLAAFMIRHGMPLPADLDDAAHARRKALVIAEGGPAREGTVRQLAAAGYAVEQASPGFAAGAAVVRFAPDVLVIHATAEDGGEVLRALRADRDLAGTPIVALGHPDWIPQLQEAGCAVAIARPPADGVLEAAVASALGAGSGGGAGGGGSPTSRRRRGPRRPSTD
ncbi:excisionase family DNA-binding protein [Anaeromyxobacter sp. Fw109-5]|uniref:excisionase family DNA-binding protein n=1 Tax=Anaeromyxobacter sp. (strain Fw109-5) TaxID=404589 RepID=UPI0000ED7120|nr:excisionase family DNA-binding protein [Anaeromyxobacter sp. Fw109-5]ABS27874.1 DNA binding domain, excisionase family [Anaeromyxobacter sp. Fw109-5]